MTSWHVSESEINFILWVTSATCLIENSHDLLVIRAFLLFGMVLAAELHFRFRQVRLSQYVWTLIAFLIFRPTQ